MFYKEKKKIEAISKKEDAKLIEGNKDEELLFHLKDCLSMLKDHYEQESAFNLCQTINCLYHYIEDKENVKKDKYIDINYSKGSILLVDFGTMNFGYEFNDVHPAVVIYQNKYQVFVAPLTSEKAYRNIPDSIFVSKKDGFKKDSIILMDQTRYISKNRVISKLGQTNVKTYMAISRYIYNRLTNKTNFL